MATSASIFLSVKERTVPGKKRFLSHRNLNLDYVLEIGILDEDADEVHRSPYDNPITVKEAVGILRFKHPGLDILSPLRDNRDAIRSYIKYKVFRPFEDSREISAFQEMRRYRGKPMFSTSYSDDGFDSRIGVSHDFLGIGASVRRRLEEYGKYWVDIVREHILGLEYHLSDKTMKVREWKEKHYPGIYSYPLGIDQPAVETGLVFNSIKWKVTNLSLDKEIISKHNQWKKEGPRKAPKKEEKKEFSKRKKIAEKSDFDEISYEDVYTVWRSKGTPLLTQKERKVLSDVGTYLGRTGITRQMFNGLKKFLFTSSGNKKSAERVLLAMYSSGYRFDVSSSMYMSDMSSHEGGYHY